MHQFFPQAQEVSQVRAKVVILGDSEVSTSALTNAITANSADKQTNGDITSATIAGIGFYFWVPDMVRIRGQGGQYFPETNIAILCFSATNREFFNGFGTLCAQVRTRAPNAQFILLCTDPARIGHENTVSVQEIEAFRKQQGIEYYRAHSVNKAVQIQELKNWLVTIIRAMGIAAVEQPADPRPLEVQAPDEERHEESRGCCTIL